MTVTAPLPTAPPVPVAAAELYEVLDRLRRLGPTGDAGMCTALLSATAALDGLALREVAALDAVGAYVPVEVPSAAAVVQNATGCSVPDARATVRLASRLAGDLRPLGDLLVAGRLTRRHCHAVAHAVRGLDPQLITASLDPICALALNTDPHTLEVELRTRAEAISPQLAQQARRRLQDRVGVSCVQTPDGTGHLTGTLTPETVALLNAVLDASIHGDRTAGDTRSPLRRRHDALLDLLRHATDCPDLPLPSQGGCRAQVTIIATAATLTGLPGAQPAYLPGAGQARLTRGELLRMLCDADISTVHLNPTMERLELSRSSRTVSPAQWRALVARDRQCIVKGCHRRPNQTQAHHIIHWAHGGTTDLANLALLCHAHHHDLHDRNTWLTCTHNRTLTNTGWLTHDP